MSVSCSKCGLKFPDCVIPDDDLEDPGKTEGGGDPLLWGFIVGIPLGALAILTLILAARLVLA